MKITKKKKRNLERKRTLGKYIDEIQYGIRPSSNPNKILEKNIENIVKKSQQVDKVNICIQNILNYLESDSIGTLVTVDDYDELASLLHSIYNDPRFNKINNIILNDQRFITASKKNKDNVIAQILIEIMHNSGCFADNEKNQANINSIFR